MSELLKAYRTIWLLYRDRLALEKLPRTPKTQKKIDELKSLEAQLKQAVQDPGFRQRLEQSAVRRAMDIAEKHGKEQSERRGNRKTWKGMTKEQLSARDKAIIAHYKRTKLTRSSFATKHAADYGLKWRRVMDIIPE